LTQNSSIKRLGEREEKGRERKERGKRGERQEGSQ